MEGPIGQKKANPKLQVISGSAPSIKERRLFSWVDGFLEYTKNLPSAEIFRKWAAIAAIAGALERKVWIYVPAYKANLYPNLYTIFVGPPASGKTIATSITQTLWSKMGDHHLAPNSVSRASLMDALREAERSIIRPQDTPSVIKFNSLLVVANELGVLMPEYGADFMNTLTDIYDGKRYGEKKRGSELNYVLLAPQINILSATTPSYLNAIMPEGAWDQGFISRVSMIYSGESVINDIFFGAEENEHEFDILLHDLKLIGNLYGKLVFTEEAAKALGKWHMLKGPPIPDHPRLQHYNGRRTTHLLKLCMVASVSQRNDLIINVEDYNTALDWLLEAERYMPDIFKSMNVGGDARAIKEAWHYSYEIYVRTKKYTSESKLIEFLSNRVPAHSVERILQVMVKSGLLEKTIEGYKPRAPKY
jgi:hypothetical protein